MAARKEKHLLTVGQATSARITRSQAAANHTRSGLAPSVPVPLKTEHKHAAKGKKREASGENAADDAGASAPQPKRRQVLKNVTNISCAKTSKRRTAVTGLKVS